MTKKEKALEMMRQRKPWKEIIKQGPSPSYSAAVDYFNEVEELYEKYSTESPRMQRELEQLKTQLASIKEQIVVQTGHREALTNENQVLANKNSELRRAGEELEKGNHELLRQEKAIHERGVRPETLLRFDLIEFGSDDELVKRISTLEHYQQLEENVISLQQKENSLKGDNSRLENTKKTLIEQVSVQRQALLEEQQKYNAYRQDLDQLARLRELNIATSNLEGLVEALIQYSTGEPESTVTTLLEAVTEYRNLQHIRTQLATAESNLNETRSQLDKAKGRLDSITEHTQRNLDQTSVNAVNAIENLEAQVSGTINRLDKDIQKWGSLREEAGKYAEYNRYGYLILGILTDPNAVKALRPYQVSMIMQKVHLWIKHNIWDSNIKPPKEIADQLGLFANTPDYKLHILSQWISIELEGGVNS